MPTIHMRYPGGLAKAVTFSYDDAVEQDVRLIEILDKYGLHGTFNVNTGLFAPEGKVYPAGQVHRRMTEAESLAAYSGGRHEVAVHGVTHPFLEQLSVPNATWEIVADKQRIEDLFGTVCRGMAYPFGTTSDAVVGVLETAGILYARTVAPSNSLEFPLGNWLRLNPTCHHNSAQLMPLAQKLVNDKPRRRPWLLYVWGHAYEFESDNNWNVIEEFASFVSGKEDIWYATNREIFEYAEAFNSLIFSSRGDRVYNPTCRELFFFKERLYSVKPGETIEIKV